MRRETHSSPKQTYTTLDLLKKVFCNPLMLMLGGVELTAGVLRNGIMQWYTVFAKQVPQHGAEFFAQNWACCSASSASWAASRAG